MKHIKLTILLIVLLIGTIHTNVFAQSNKIVDSDKAGIGNVVTWNVTSIYLNIYGHVQPESNIDVFQYTYPVGEGKNLPIAFVIRKNSGYQFESIKFPNGICYIGNLQIIELSDEVYIGKIIHSIDTDCTVYRATVDGVNQYLKYYDSKQTQPLERHN